MITTVVLLSANSRFLQVFIHLSTFSLKIFCLIFFCANFNPSSNFKSGQVKFTRISNTVKQIVPYESIAEGASYDWGSVKVSGKLPTDPSPKLTFCPR